MAAGEYSAKQRRRGLDFAARLATVALEAPDLLTKRETYKAVQAIRKKYGFTREQKKQQILLLVKVGASTISELVIESGFHRDDVHELTAELEREDRVVSRTMSIGGGRPSVCFFLK